jgi:Aldo/keto reductase family
MIVDLDNYIGPIAWLLTKPVVTSVILGAKRLDQLQDNLAAVELELTADEIKLLHEVSTLPPEYPGWMFPVQSAGRLGALDGAAWNNFQPSNNR